MTKSRKTQANHSTRAKAAKLESSKAVKVKAKTESFDAVAARAGEALADLLEHEDCPDKLAELISRFHSDCCNEFGDLTSNLRHNFHVTIGAC